MSSYNHIEIESKWQKYWIEQKSNKVKDSKIKDLEMSVSNKVGLNVIIQNKKNNKGKIIFEYKELDQLNKIIEIIKNNY